jgi:DNA-binding MarR family transcriptional regulator
MSLDHPENLDQLFNNRLSRLLASSSAPSIRLFEGGYGVSRREWRLVGLVAVYGAMSPSELAERAHLERPRVSRVLTGLVQRGLLARVGLPNDRRRARVEITPAGRRLYEEVFPQLVRLHERVLSALSPQQVVEFDAMLVLLTEQAEILARTSQVTLKAARHLGGRKRNSG